MNRHPLLAPAAHTALAYPPPGAWMPPLPPGAARLSAGYPFPESVPVEALLAAAGDLLTREADAPLQYLGSPAMADLPERLRARMIQRGMPVAREELLVTSGSCQAIDLAARVLVGPGDLVAVEAPTYMEALEIFRNYTPNVVGYPVDEQGLDVEALGRDLAHRRAAGQPLPRLFYTIPSFQNPTGATLPLARRRQLLDLAAEYGFVVVEDDAYGELAFRAEAAPPPLKALDGAGRVLYLGSLSKVVAPGLRVGWAAGPRRLVAAMAVFKKDLDHPFTWALTDRYLAGIDLEQRVAWLRQRYRERRDRLVAALAAHMPDGITWSRPEGGFFVWVTLPPGLDSGALLSRALAAGVAYVPGKYFYPAFHLQGAGGEVPDREGGDGEVAAEAAAGAQAEAGARQLRLSFSYLPPVEMERGVAALARVIREAGGVRLR